MARRTMVGQLNMFDFWNNLSPQEESGVVEMVSLMPDGQEEESKESERIEEIEEIEESDCNDEPECEETAETPEETVRIDLSDKSASVMHREVFYADGSLKGEISYLNYNKVYIKRPGQEGEIKAFDNSKDAVDYYIDEMQKLEA